ncbi:MAG: organic solvent tolerance protein OstA [Flavobacteriales bacterium]|nr:organic solvent tolerance protein OstA [Flavobacteriales bacterium]
MRSLLFIFGLIHLAFFALAQEEKKVKKIELRNAEVLEYDESLGHKARRLLGNVVFEHEGALMYCDSAYLYEDNSMDAFSHVFINKGDSIKMWCEELNYNGNTEFAKAKRQVKLIDNEMTLTSDKLDYNMKSEQAWYNTGGKIVDSENTLTSRIGYYYSTFEEVFFKDSVKLVNEQYTLYCDTLRYNTKTEVAFFLGPTKIISDENTVLSNFGWYDTELDISQFSNDATVLSKDQSIKGDSLYYNKKHSYGIAIGNVEVADTSQDIILTGGRAKYYEVGDMVLLTDSAVMIQAMGSDSLFLHADTLLSIIDTVIDRRILFAFHHVKFFKPDMRGKCDSLVYSYADSTIRLYRDPILWSDENQLTADSMWIQNRNNRIDKLFMKENSMIISEEDSAMFNQIKGRYMTGFFKEQKLRRVFVEGNGETIYYAAEEGGGKPENVNRAKASNLIIIISDNKVKDITFLTQPDATLYPMNKVNLNDMKLEGFDWRIEDRPEKVEDIFEW